jgi:hypothetical protein
LKEKDRKLVATCGCTSAQPMNRYRAEGTCLCSALGNSKAHAWKNTRFILDNVLILNKAIYGRQNGRAGYWMPTVFHV